MNSSLTHRPLIVLAFAVLLACLSAIPSRAAGQEKIAFTEEKLDNGLDVIYAPLHQAPVVHVQVTYFVGSRDERADRQGFAHMFEHMMFRGSAHVKPEEHGKLINGVGGYSNANTWFDRTNYVDTLPANQLELALYLEADRMASFKVSEETYKIERSVVAKEWGMDHNMPYFDAVDRVLEVLYTKHPYRWTPLGNMDHLKAAPVSELQEFFNKYYVPNNAALILAGDIDVAKAKALVRKYFAWVPAGAPVHRDITPEPPQTKERRVDIRLAVPLAAVGIAWHAPPGASDDNDALDLLASVLGGGRSSRIREALVNGKKPLCAEAMAQTIRLVDGGLFAAGGAVLPGRDASAVEKALREMVADVREKGVTPEELQRTRVEARLAAIASRQTAENVAELLAEEKSLSGDAGRVNSRLARLEALTSEDLRDVARKYLRPEQATVVKVTPNYLGMLSHLVGGGDTSAKVAEVEKAGVAPSTKPVEPRKVQFPAGYPERPPVSPSAANPKFAKGRETTVNGVRVIVISDSRLPLVYWTLAMPGGSEYDPPGKTGAAGVMTQLLRRGAAGMGYKELNDDLESRGISIDATSGLDFTFLSGSCFKDDADHAIERTRQVLLEPTMPAEELEKIKSAEVAGLQTSLATPTTVAEEDLRALLFGGAPMGRSATPASVQAVTLEDVKRHYATVCRPEGAVLVMSGDVSFERGTALAEKLLSGWKAQGGPVKPAAVAGSSSSPSAARPAKRRVVLVDNPGGKQSVIQMGVPAYDIHSEERYAGAAAGSILSAGIESRLGKYVRAEKGYAYYVGATFNPERLGGSFTGRTETGFETTAAAIKAVFKVLGDMREQDVTAAELAEARARTAGSLLMGMQTIQQQAGRRLDAILDGFPDDYYDRYPERIGAVTAGQVREVMNRYVREDRMQIVVVAPKDKVLKQLAALARPGEVEVRPMPGERRGAATRPSEEPQTETGGRP